MLTIGSKVHFICYGGKDGIIYNINGTQRPETVKQMGAGFMVTGGSADFDIVWNDGSMSSRIPESLLVGSVQWKIREGLATPDEIIQALENADKAAAKAASDKAAAAAAFDLETERVIAAYPYLLQSPGSGGKGAAKNIRTELKRAWPAVKFSVVSIYSKVDIRWTDGPTDKQVEEITDKYSAGSFNGMEDIYEYSRSAFNNQFGSAQYIFTRRDNSEKEFNRAFSLVKEYYAGNLQGFEVATLADFNSGKLWNVPMNFGGSAIRDNLQSVISGALAKLPEAGYEYKSKITKTEAGYNLYYYDMSYGKWYDREENSIADCYKLLEWNFWR